MRERESGEEFFLLTLTPFPINASTHQSLTSSCHTPIPPSHPHPISPSLNPALPPSRHPTIPQSPISQSRPHTIPPSCPHPHLLIHYSIVIQYLTTSNIRSTSTCSGKIEVTFTPDIGFTGGIFLDFPTVRLHLCCGF